MSNYYFNITYKCNMDCVFCAADLDSCNMIGDIKLNEIIYIANKCNINKDDFVILNGGEPTVHTQLIPIVKEIKRRGAEISLFTNGKKLSNKKLTKKLLEEGVKNISIPFYTLKNDNFLKITSTKNLNDVIDSLMYLDKLKNYYDFNFTLKILVLKYNYTEIPEIIKWIIKNVLNVNCIDINGLILSETALRNNVYINYNESAKYIVEGINLILDKHIRLHLESIPLCKLDSITMIRYLRYKANYKEVKDSNNNLYYDKLNDKMIVDNFNDNKNYCYKKECKLSNVCRMNPLSEF